MLLQSPRGVLSMVTKRAKKRKGFTRSQKQWEESIATHIGKLIDKVTPTDILNFVMFGTTAWYTYQGIEAVVKAEFPEWLKYLSPLSPFLYQLVIPAELADIMTTEQKLAISIMAGYSALKIPGILMQESPKLAAALAGA